MEKIIKRVKIWENMASKNGVAMAVNNTLDTIVFSRILLSNKF